MLVSTRWAWHRGHRYGTLIVNLDTHRPLVVLPGRDQRTLAAWFRKYPEIQVVSRDRGGNSGRSGGTPSPAHQPEPCTPSTVARASHQAFVSQYRSEAGRAYHRLIGETEGPTLITHTACRAKATSCCFPSWHTDNYPDPEGSATYRVAGKACTKSWINLH